MTGGLGARRPAGKTPLVRMFVNGEAMRARPLNAALGSAHFLGTARSAPRYRFFSVRDEYPAMHPTAEGGGSVLGELYAVTYATLREQLLPREPSELELGVIELDDGTSSLAMRLRDGFVDAHGLTDITAIGSWRRYRGFDVPAAGPAVPHP